jgi:hypothetical protein
MGARASARRSVIGRDSIGAFTEFRFRPFTPNLNLWPSLELGYFGLQHCSIRKHSTPPSGFPMLDGVDSCSLYLARLC